jgi:hypothetical protein
MHDEFESRPAAPRIALGDLPLLSPPRSAWPALEAKLAARRPRHRAVPWLALAAALALAAVLPRWLAAPAPVDAPVVATAAVAAPDATAAPRPATLAALMAESAQLETLIAWGPAEPVESAVAASLGSALQDRIESIDALLARPDTDPEALLPLWQERVLRLRQLAGLASTQQLLAANGESGRGVPVLAF